MSNPPIVSNMHRVFPDIEPDDEWKQNLRKTIENRIRKTKDDANHVLDAELRAAVTDESRRLSLNAQHLKTMKAIEDIAKAEFEHALDEERRRRHRPRGSQTNDRLNEVLPEEPQYIRTESIRTRNRDPPSELERQFQRPTEKLPYLPEGSNSRMPPAPKVSPEFLRPPHR
jgi:hypothetical protein